MRKVFLLFACLMAAMKVCSAQTDTLIGKWGEAIPVKVKSFAKNGLRVERLMQTVDDKLMHVKYTDLKALRFEDGFELQFRDGALVRDNVLSAPLFRRSFLDVKAEDVLTLTQAELRQYYGVRNYDVVYKPYRSLCAAGFGKLIGGAMLFYGSAVHSRYSRRAGMSPYMYARGDEMVLYRTYYSTGYFDPFWSTAAYFFLGTMVDGLMDCTASYLGHRKLFNHFKEEAIPSAAASKGMVWSGVAMSAAGLGALAFSFAEMKDHHSWSYTVTVPEGVNPNTGNAVKEGDPPASWVKYALIGGALAANLGFSAIQLGAMRLSALHHLEGTPDAVQIHVGPSPSGYGLTMRF